MSEMITLAKEIVNVVMKNKLYILLFLAFLFSGTTLWAQQKATPKAGEGISSPRPALQGVSKLTGSQEQRS